MNKDCNSDGNQMNSALPPSHLLVIAGILSGALDVISVLVNKNQVIEIVLAGSLRKKTDLEKMMDKIGSHPFDEVVRAMLDRLK